jgi:hypothetical protein
MKKKEINPGMMFGYYKILEETDRKNSNRMFKVQCICGNKRIVVLDNLLRGKAKSCGCKREKHGLSRHPLYSTWDHLRQRCMNPHNEKYPLYGGRGIKVCNEWMTDFKSFYSWAISHGYKRGLSIDRENNDGDYTPDNCRFTTVKIQQNNRTSNSYLEINGIKKTIAQWSYETGINYDTIWARVKRYGFKNEQIIKQPN